MSVFWRTVALLTVSNLFMLAAWYYHLRALSDRPWYVAAVVSWSIALCEYMFHIPANRIGSTALSLPQLQILQVGMSLILFVPFTLIVMQRPLQVDYLWAALCLAGAAYFTFRGG